jgi:hypothetical protein
MKVRTPLLIVLVVTLLSAAYYLLISIPKHTKAGEPAHFRLRLVDSKGAKYQKVYDLFDTITRVIGTLDGWASDAMPQRPASKRRIASR